MSPEEKEQDCRKLLKLTYRCSRLEKIELDGALLLGLHDSRLTGDSGVPSLEELREKYRVVYEELK